MVQRWIRAASNRGAVVTRLIEESAAKALMSRYPNEVGKINVIDSEYGKSVLQRMNYARRRGTTSKLHCPMVFVRKMSFFFIIKLWKKLNATIFPIH